MAAPVVIPYAMTQLATGVNLDATLTTAQVVFTTGPSDKAIPLFLVFRDASTAVNAATTFNLGVTGSASSLLSAATTVQSLAAGGNFVVAVTYATAGASSKPYVPGNTSVIITFGGTQTSNGTLKCDVYGALTVF